ncbi:iron-dependent peroxidase [Paenibacillus xylaniclasticus]|uniref:iron-dependent peroxidase n=1 Tax=Paenibacillus xylaniclasticus TaxID=588083 RepID=UPI000FD739CD|nr:MULTISPECIES: iron-dependent peroxidase [Paenibacillus]GFN32139.1 hypothetical protein PCURB6_23990 [Paenibacillus curdlanolyticus]
MNYIWELAIRAQQEGMDRKELRFVSAESFSPYMELSLPTLNPPAIEPVAEINPYYRFHSIMDELCDRRIPDDMELRETLFDLVTHLLVELDVLQGMNKREMYVRFLIADMENGIFGAAVQKRLPLFSDREKEIIALQLLRCYETGESHYMWKETVRRLFPDVLLYAKSGSADELMLYFGKLGDKRRKEQLLLLQELFLPLTASVELMWDGHIGIMGVEETMRLDEAVLY